VGLVFVSADREAFEELRGWKETVVEVGLLAALISRLIGAEIGEGEDIAKDRSIDTATSLLCLQVSSTKGRQ